MIVNFNTGEYSDRWDLAHLEVPEGTNLDAMAREFLASIGKPESQFQYNEQEFVDWLKSEKKFREVDVYNAFLGAFGYKGGMGKVGAE